MALEKDLSDAKEALLLEKNSAKDASDARMYDDQRLKDYKDKSSKYSM
jgi:hypothetical protein